MTKIGRNAPCPCGSGKKYKRCCSNARSGTSEPAPPTWNARPGISRPAPPAEPLDRLPLPSGAGRDIALVMERLKSQDTQWLSDMFVALQELVVSGGPLEGLRFDSGRFGELVVPLLKTLTATRGPGTQTDLFAPDEDPEEPGWQVLIERVGPELCDDEWIERSIGQLGRFLAQRPSPGRAQREAAAAGLVFLMIEQSRDGSVEPWRTVTAEAVFLSQLRGWLEDRDKLGRYVEGLAQALKSGELDAEGLRRKLEEDGEDLSGLFGSSPELMAGMQRQTEEELQRAYKLVRRRRPPPLLRGDETALFYAVLFKELCRYQDAVQEDDPDELARVRKEAVPRVIEGIEEQLGPELRSRIMSRCAERADATRRKGKKRDQAALAAAVELEPGNLILFLLMNKRSRPEAVHPGEEELLDGLFLDLADPARGLADYADFLEGFGDAEGAERVRQAERLLAPEERS